MADWRVGGKKRKSGPRHISAFEYGNLCRNSEWVSQGCDGGGGDDVSVFSRVVDKQRDTHRYSAHLGPSASVLLLKRPQRRSAKNLTPFTQTY